MAADDEAYPPAEGVSDTRERVASSSSWRRIVGGTVMALGALIAIGFFALALIVAVTFLDWRNPFDGLTTISMITIPPMLAGGALLALGRWVYGGWRANAPIARSAAFALPFAGVVAAFAAIAFFFWALFDETGRGGVWALSQFVVSLMASLAMICAGLAMRWRLRSV